MANFQCNLEHLPPQSEATLWLRRLFGAELFGAKTFFDERTRIKQSGNILPPLLTPVNIPDYFTKDLFADREQFDFKGIISDEMFASGYSIGLIDTGVRISHQDLRTNSIETLNSNPNSADATDKHGHGTHIAGILAAKGIKKGMVPGAPIVSYKVTDDDDGNTSWVRISDALDMIIDRIKNTPQGKNKISVVNLSYNAFTNLQNDVTEEEIYSKRIRSQIDTLFKFNVPLVASGGNYFDAFVKWEKDGTANNPNDSYGLAFPANHTPVIACGASCIKGLFTTRRGTNKNMSDEDLAPFTQRPNPGEYYNQSSEKTFITTPAIATKSLGIASDASYSVLMGSSMAAPVITGIIYLIQQLNLKRVGSLLSVPDIKKALLEMCKPRQNNGGSEFRNQVKSSKAFFDKQNYLQLNEEMAEKYFQSKPLESH